MASAFLFFLPSASLHIYLKANNNKAAQTRIVSKGCSIEAIIHIIHEKEKEKDWLLSMLRLARCCTKQILNIFVQHSDTLSVHSPVSSGAAFRFLHSSIYRVVCCVSLRLSIALHFQYSSITIYKKPLLLVWHCSERHIILHSNSNLFICISFLHSPSSNFHSQPPYCIVWTKRKWISLPTKSFIEWYV